MTYRTDDGYDEEEDEPKRGLLSWILIVALLVGTGSGSALLWRALGGSPVLSFAAATAEKQGGQGDVDALRQQLTGSVQATQQLLATQQAEIKRLSDQVSVLTEKLDLLQRPVTSAQAAIPVPAPKAAAPAAKKRPDAVKPVAAKPFAGTPAEAKPAPGPISTGGTPLPLSR